MSGKNAPTLSVVVVAFNGSALLRRCLKSLRSQTLKDGVEVLVIDRGEADQEEERRLRQWFREVQWIRASGTDTVAQMRALGIGRSRGQIVALLEDDCIASETWCARLVETHRGNDAAVGGAVGPGEYSKVLDWALYFCEYGRYMPPLPEGEVSALPGTNVSYKRTALTGLLGSGLSSHAFYETFVHLALRRAGQTLRADPALMVRNISSWTVSRALLARYHHGRTFAGLRVAGRSLWRRVPFLGLAVVLPILQVGRITKQVLIRKRYVREMRRALPWIALSSISWSMGEFVGYLLGPGRSPQQWR
jgi:hypothetical protein